MSVPAVSVVVPVYNAAAFVRRAIDSVLAQTWSDRELLVVDDGSTDDTRIVLAGYGARLRVLSQDNAGPAAARNHGLREARGEFIAFLDADDWWLPAKLERQVALMRNRPDVGFCSTTTLVVASTGEPEGDWPCCAPDSPLPETLFVRSAAISGSTSGVLARRAHLTEVGGFDEALHGFEDPDLWIRLAARAGYACIPEPLTVIVRTPGSVSSHLPRMRAATLASLRKNRGLLPPGKRGAFWRDACAGALLDYAKMAARAGRRDWAWRWAGEAALHSPFGRGRWAWGLMRVLLSGRQP